MSVSTECLFDAESLAKVEAHFFRYFFFDLITFLPSIFPVGLSFNKEGVRP
jgi:hypothetical protein